MCQLAEGKAKASALKEKFNLKARTLYGYKRKVTKQLRICESGGRPKSLSKEVEQALRQMLHDNPSMAEPELRSKIRQLHHQFWLETYPNADKDTHKRISRRTVQRYSERLRSEVFG
jgi:hypothetical protein